MVSLSQTAGSALSNNPLPVRSRVNFINMFTSSFYTRISKKRKTLLDLTVFFALLVSTGVKTAYRMLMKLTPRYNFEGSGGKGEIMESRQTVKPRCLLKLTKMADSRSTVFSFSYISMTFNSIRKFNRNLDIFQLWL